MLSTVSDRFPARPVLVGCGLLSGAAIAAMLIPGIPVLGLLGLLLFTGTVAPVFQGTAHRAATSGPRSTAKRAQLLTSSRNPIRLRDGAVSVWGLGSAAGEVSADGFVRPQLDLDVGVHALVLVTGVATRTLRCGVVGKAAAGDEVFELLKTVDAAGVVWVGCR